VTGPESKARLLHEKAKEVPSQDVRSRSSASFILKADGK